MVGELLQKKVKKDVSPPPNFELDELPEPPSLDNEPGFDLPDSKEMPVPVPKSVEKEKKPELKPIDVPKIEELPKKVDGFPKSPKVEVKKQELPQMPSFDKLSKEFPEPPKLDSKKLKPKIDAKKDIKPLPSRDKLSTELPEPPKLDMKPPSVKKDSNKKLDMPKKQSKSLFSMFKKKKKQNVKLEEPFGFELPMYHDLPKGKDLETKQPVTEKEPYWVKEGESYFREQEMLNEAQPFLEVKEEDFQPKETPLNLVKGIGPMREKQLKKAGVKTAENLAELHHKEVAEKAKLPVTHAKKIVTHAKKITKIKKRLKSSPKKEKNISDIIQELEQEKKAIEKIQAASDINEDKLIELEGHKEIITVLEKLEKKRAELSDMQNKLEEKETKLQSHDEVYRRDKEHVEKLKRRLDHDIRERTRYLINLEKEYFQKAQTLAKKQSEIEIKESTLNNKNEYLQKRETDAKKILDDLENREITIETKEKKLQKIMDQLEEQDVMLREKEDDIIKREAEYLKKLDTLETHEKSILKNLENKRKSLEKKEKVINQKEKRLHTTQRKVDKQEVAVEYAKNIVEEEKNKLIDDEFEQYLHDQLRGAKPGIQYNDLNTLSNLKIPNLNDRNRSIYQLIDNCKALLRNNKVNEAKIFYNQVRDRYYNSNFKSNKEKQSVHNSVRALYDEINLADIGRN